MKNIRDETEARESRIKEVVMLLDRAVGELQALGIDMPASYVAMAHDLLVERLFTNRARPFG